MNKLVLFDVDGVVLRHGSEEPSRRVIEVGRGALLAGNMLLPVSSRTAKLMGGVATGLGLRDLGVLDGGATIFDFARQERDVALSRWLGVEKTDEIVQAAGPHCQEVYYGEDSTLYKAGEPVEGASPSVFAVYPNASADAVESALSGINGINAHTNAYEGGSTHSCVQVVSQGVDKGTGERLVLSDPRYASVAPENMMVIADGDPDVALFMAAPRGAWRVAMGNAGDRLLQVADHVAPHVDDDGFAVALEQFLAR